MKAKYLFLLMIVMPLASVAQTKLKSIEVSEDISRASVDRPGDIYITTVSGQFQRFSKDGVLGIVYKNNPTPDLFDPRDGARLFAFYRKNRVYAYLNPTFEVNKSFLVDSAFIVDPWLVCASGDLNVWAADASDAIIRKVNVGQGRIDAEAKLPASVDIKSIRTIREYQSFLFVLTDKSILIYNSIGKLIKTIETRGTYFNFLGEEMYYMQNGKLIFLDLFSGETREMILPAPCQQALITDERLYLVQQKTIDLFEVKPDK